MPKDKRVHVTIDLCPVELRAVKFYIARNATYETVPEFLKRRLQADLDSIVSLLYAAQTAGVRVSE
jgi:hypothetical protein